MKTWRSTAASWFAAIVTIVLALIAFRSIYFLIHDPVLRKADALIAGVCLAGALLVYRHHRLRLERSVREDPERIERRLVELGSLARSPDFEFAVEGKSRLLPILCMLFVTGSVLVPFVLFRAWPLVAILGVLFVAAFLLLPRAIDLATGPTIVLQRDGFRATMLPFVSWDDVRGIRLHGHGRNGYVYAYELTFRIPSLEEADAKRPPVVRAWHWLIRRSSRKGTWIPLWGLQESPVLIYRLARQLWTAHTGRDHDWNPFCPEEVNSNLSRLDEAGQLLRAPQPMEGRSPAETERLLRQLTNSAAALDTEADRNMHVLRRISRWVTALVVVMIAAGGFLLAQVIRTILS